MSLSSWRRNSSREVLRKLNAMKRDIIHVRKSVWPLRELANAFCKTDSAVVSEPTRAYLRDVYDHTLRVIETIDTFRDIQSGMLERYLSSLSNRMNEVMKVLTVIATVFIPLTFIVGVYGMNFRFMPELEWEWAYPVVWLVMVGVALFMVVFFQEEEVVVKAARLKAAGFAIATIGRLIYALSSGYDRVGSEPVYSN